MITFNILGCCICRDIFRLNPDEKFKVNKFIQYSNPISTVDEKQNQKRLKSEDLDDVIETGFVKRCLCYDFNKNIMSTIKKNPADYLIIDMCELRYPVRKIKTNKEEFFISKTKHLPIVLSVAEKLPAFEGLEYFEDFRVSQEEIDEGLTKYVNFLKSCYSPKKIILIKSYPTHKQINTNSLAFEEIDPTYTHNLTETFKYANDFVEKNIPGINIIEIPENALGYAGHTLGTDVLHFVDEYYRYLYECICVIVNKQKDKEEKLKELKSSYFKYFEMLNKYYEMKIYLNTNSPATLLKNSDFEIDENGDLKDWTVSLSKGSVFNKETKTLTCGNETANWAIVSQKINIEPLINKNITVSIKHRCIENSLFNIAIRGKILNGSWKYFAMKQYSTLCENIETLSVFVDESFKDYEFVDVAFYVNTPNASVQIIETKLEEGTKSSLF